MSSFFDGVEITWDLGTADLALEHKAAISSLYDLGQSLNLSGNLSSSVRRATGRSLTVWLSVLCVNNHDNS